MNFKVNKYEVIDNAQRAAIDSLRISLGGQGATPDPSTLQWAISNAITNAVRSIVNDMYTDEEFEQDIGLK